jgi:Glycosyl transferases group 1.
LIRAIKILKDNLIDSGFKDIWNKLEVYIYGDGSKKAELIELSCELGITDKIKFKGKIPHSEVPNALDEFDIFLYNES